MSNDKDLLPEVSIGMVGHVGHGKTTLTKALTGKWTQKHSQELKRGITIRLGYANFVVRKCPEGGEYTVDKKCQDHDVETEVLRKISIVDSPGHETLMATMLSGSAIMDGAVLVISADEPCPQPQTREHLKALEIRDVEDLIVVQNKVDLISEEEAKENYEQIKDFLEGTIAEDAPVIPISAHFGTNMDILLEKIQEIIEPSERKEEEEPVFLVARSFDINKPGTDVSDLRGGVLGGALKQGSLSADDEIVIEPGRKVEENNKVQWKSLSTKVSSLFVGDKPVETLKHGGSSSIGTQLDPFVTKSDKLVGQVVGHPDEMPPTFEEMKLRLNLFDKVVGTQEEMEIEDIKTNDQLMINAWTARSIGVVTTSYEGNKIEVSLKIPICIDKDEKVALSKRFGQKWRLIGYGEIIE